MPATSPSRRLRRGAAARPGDAGFTLVEVLVSIAVLGVMMAALTSFFVTTLAVAGGQSDRQAAVQVAADALERVRAIQGSAAVAGRDHVSTDNQWAAPVAGVGPYLGGMTKVWDDEAVYPDGASAGLPTAPQPVVLGGNTYVQSWYVGQCWQPLLGGACAALDTPAFLQYYRIVVAVTWTGRRCTAGTCSYVTATLVNSSAEDPVFNAKLTARAPTVPNPGAHSDEAGVTVSPESLAANGGAPPLTWSATGLPPGLAVSSSGTLSGTPTTVGTYLVTVRATDGYSLIGSAAFTWTIVAGITLTNPGAQSTPGGTAMSLPLVRTGGTAPFSWSVAKPNGWGGTGLPAGLSINASTGVISGTPTATGTAIPLAVTVTDGAGATATVTIAWTVPPLTVANPGPRTGGAGGTFTPVTVTAAGGIKPYGYAATGLPAGLAISATTGTISGRPATAGSYPVQATVTDAAHTAVTVSFTITVAVAPVITVTSLPDSTRALGAAVSVQAAATGGTAPYTWTATNLPPGLTISSGGLISGTVTGLTRYIASVTVTDKVGASDVEDVIWTVTNTASTDLRLTAPTGDRTADRVGTAISPVTAAYAGGSGFTRTWAATGYPPGIGFNTQTHVLSGTPTVAGTYLTTLTVKDSTRTATFMFYWTVT